MKHDKIRALSPAGIRFGSFRLILPLVALVAFSACNDRSTTADSADELPALSADASAEDMAQLLVTADNRRRSTPALAQVFPDLDRERAYEIQLASLDLRLDDGGRVTGWKLGGTRVTDPDSRPDPLFGYSLASHVYQFGSPLPAMDFVGGAPEVEAEVAIHIGRDLQGPEVSMEELMDAISGVGGAVELLSKRLSPYPDGDATSLTPSHAVADNLSHGGVMLSATLVPPQQFEFDDETAVARINGVVAAEGSSRDIMGGFGTPLDAVLWLANELPRHGLYLKAGDYVVTGSLYANPTATAGDSVEVEFSSLGSISFTVQ